MNFARQPSTLSCDVRLDEALEEVIPGAAAFLIWPREGRPYLGRTSMLRRRLKRLLRRPEKLSKLLNLRNTAERVEYWPVASQLESTLVYYELARTHHPDDYLDVLKLRMPPYVKLILSNEFPRTQVTTKLTGGSGQFYGPFRTRATADEFDHQLLDLFQIRRCQEDLQPSPDHPGCIYGEMSMCVRPCQQVVSPGEYSSEVGRVSEFLRTDGRTALAGAESARERLSAEMEFEAAAREHKRAEKIQEALSLRDDLVRDVAYLSGVAVVPALESGQVLLWPVMAGVWQQPLNFLVAGDQSLSLDRRLREALASVIPEPAAILDRQEHLAILARWYYSSWRDGSWIAGESLAQLPWHRLVSAVSRTVHQSAPAASH